MKKLIIVLSVITLSLVTLMFNLKEPTKNMRLYSKPTHTPDKKVVLIIIDSLVDQPLESLIKNNQVPLFQFLMENGWYTNQMVSSFPTMSVTIDSTLLTGTQPHQHRIPALRWYDIHENRYINYGDGALPVLRTGMKTVINDSLYNLNNRHLRQDVRTLHEELANKGMSTASINGIIHRGKTDQLLSIPRPYEDIQTKAPDYFVLGNFHHYTKTNVKEQYMNYYGVNDEVSNEHLIHLIQNQGLPAFTMVYFPDLDHEAHKHGSIPSEALIDIDRKLQRMFNSFDSWSKALEEHVFIIMGDSGVVKIEDDKQVAVINLEEIFSSFQLAELGKSRSTDELALAVNERMTYVYPLQAYIQKEQILEKIRNERRLDTISWKNGNWLEVRQGGTMKQMRFRPGSQYRDPYDQSWDIEGDLSILDLHWNHEIGRLTYGDYPDGLMRLYSAAHSHDGDFLILTSHPGYEMKAIHSHTHVGGGAHGSFHKEDTYFPLFIAGTTEKLESLRVVDLKSYILRLLD